MKRVLSMLLVLCLVFSLLPASVLATEPTQESAPVETATSESAPTLDAATLYWPVPGHTKLSQSYSSNHKAIDINDSSIKGATIVAAIGGTIRKIWTCTQQHYGDTHTCDGTGTGMWIQGTDGRHYSYAHMQAGSIPSEYKVGSKVESGAMIGKVGTTGNSSGYHLHFSISNGSNYYDSRIDPMNETYTYTGAESPYYFTELPEKMSVSDTDAVIALKFNKPTGTSASEYGARIFNATHRQLGSVSDTSGAFTNSTYIDLWWTVSSGLKVTLAPGRTYYYDFWIKVDGVTYYSSLYEFQTTGTAQYTVKCFDNYSGKNYFMDSAFANGLNSQFWSSRDTSVYQISADSAVTHNGYNTLKIVGSSAGSSGKDLAFSTTTNSSYNYNEGYGDFRDMTMSFWAKSTVNGAAMHFRWGYQDTNEEQVVILSDQWEYYTINMTKDLEFGYNIHPYIDTACTVWLSELQLEDGTEATEFVNETGGYTTVTVYGGGTYTDLPTPTRDGYRFDGWYSSKNSGWQILNTDPVDACNRSLYARWTTTSGTCGENAFWSLDHNGHLTITGTGAIQDFFDPETEETAENNAWHDFAEDITSVSIAEGITRIGNAAFASHINLSSVELPGTLESIGHIAFSYCGISGIELPDSVISIGDHAFAGSPNVKAIHIPASVTNIGCGAFFELPLESLTVAEGNTCYLMEDGVLYRFSRQESQIGSALEPGDYILREQVHTYIPANAASEYVIPGTVMEIADFAFYNDHLTTVTIPSTVTSIGIAAFAPENIQTLIFQGDMPTMTADTFFENTLTISRPAGNPTWTEDARAALGQGITWETHGDNTLVAHGSCGENARWILDNTGKLTVSGQGATDNYAWINYLPWWHNFFDVTFIEVGSGITHIGQCAFMGSFGGSNVTGVKLNEGLKSIGDYGFSLQLITEITIPSTVEKLGTCAFYYCPALESITFTGDAPIFGNNVFGDTSETLTAYYPANNPTWTDEVMQDYGGNVTWVPYGMATEIASGWSGDTSWTLMDDGVLTFSGYGAMKNYETKSEMPWYDYRDQIQSVVIETGVTRIGSYAFYGMDITSIEIPASVTEIGSFAFKNCTRLDNVVLPVGLVRLGESAFYACSSLRSIEIPASLWTVQPYTFKYCTALTEVIFHEGNLEKISDGAFYGTDLAELVLPDCLDILDTFAFKGCSALASITIGSGLTELREAVFYGSAITGITIPEGITKIGPYVFKNCVALETIDLPDTLTSVGEASFYACTALAELDLPDAVTTIGNYAFRKCTSLTSVDLGKSLISIGESSFYGCESITSLSIPRGVTTIQGYAFKGCTALEEVDLPSTLTTIGESAFHSCTSLYEMIIPAKVSSIGAYCFSGSVGIEIIEFLGDAPSIGEGAFNKITLTAYYPDGNATWTADNMRNYGGNVTWKSN